MAAAASLGGESHEIENVYADQYLERTSPTVEESKDNREGNLDHLSAEDQQQLAHAKSEALAANATEFTLLDMSGQGCLDRNEIM